MVAEAVTTDQEPSPEPSLPEVRTIEVASTIHVRDLARRELDVRLMPWGRPVQTQFGTEEFARGAFSDTDPSTVLLQGLEHEAYLGLGQGGQPVITRHPVGRALSIDDREDGGYATFKVAQTSRGDEVLALASDGIASGVSVEFSEVPGGTVTETRSGRRHAIHNRVRLSGASTTYRPAYPEAVVLAVRTEDQGDPPMPEQAAPVEATPETQAPPAVDYAPLTTAMQTMSDTMNRTNEAMTTRLAALEEMARTDFRIPQATTEPEVTATRGEWMQTALRLLSGERVADSQMRTLADIITTDNVGAVPPQYSSEMIGVIDPIRRFLNSTRKLDTPTQGMSLIVPTITTKPTAGTQSTEKTELTSTATSVTTTTFDAITKGGAGDISLQLLKRSSPSFLSLYLELLAEAYANEAEEAAIAALFDETVNIGGVIDPEDLSLGDAWIAAAALRQQLDTLWMSSAAIGAFIDAKADTTNMPLYSTLQADFTARTGVGGVVSGLRPVWVPALDATAVDVIAGPSRGFGWAEDGQYTLQVDVPATAGKDVAVVGILWFAPMYPGAFTTYSLGS